MLKLAGRPPNKHKRIKVGLSIRIDIMDKLTTHCDNTERNKSYIVDQALLDYLKGK